jgi:3-phytase
MMLVCFFLYLVTASNAWAQAVSVMASAESVPVPHSGDAADDPCVWVHPSDSSLSTIIGTDKQGGLQVYDLTGKEIQYLSGGNMNNVDIRYNIRLNGQYVDIVTAGNRSNNSIAVFAVDPVTRRLTNVAAATINTSISVYGSCMYKSPRTGRLYVFLNSQSGQVEQWELYDNGKGKITGSRVRSFSVGSQTEGCVSDDQFGYFYIAEEVVGIWKYGAEPTDGVLRQKVDAAGAAGRLVADIEGLTIYYATGGGGYLIASSQGSSEYVVYRREGTNSYVGKFKIVAGNGIDGVTGTDGIDVISTPLGSNFPGGLFIAQDTNNTGGNQNFKFVKWNDIAVAVQPNLTIDAAWNPRTSDYLSVLAPENLRFVP